MDLKAHQNRNNVHPVLREPPVAHALHRWEEEQRRLTYEYNGRILLSAHVPGNASVGYRHGSDGSLTSQPMVQQLYHEPVRKGLDGQKTTEDGSFEDEGRGRERFAR